MLTPDYEIEECRDRYAKEQLTASDDAAFRLRHGARFLSSLGLQLSGIGELFGAISPNHSFSGEIASLQALFRSLAEQAWHVEWLLNRGALTADDRKQAKTTAVTPAEPGSEGAR